MTARENRSLWIRFAVLALLVATAFFAAWRIERPSRESSSAASESTGFTQRSSSDIQQSESTVAKSPRNEDSTSSAEHVAKAEEFIRQSEMQLAQDHLDLALMKDGSNVTAQRLRESIKAEGHFRFHVNYQF